MILRKSALLLGLVLVFTTSIFAADLDFTTVLKPFGDFFTVLFETENKIIDGIALLITFAGTFAVFRSIFSGIFTGNHSAGAVKGMSSILSVMIVGALVIHNPGESFVGFYGGLLLSLILLFIASVLLVLVFKWTKSHPEMSLLRKIFWIALVAVLTVPILISLMLDIMYDKNSFIYAIVIPFLEGFWSWAFIALLVGLFSWMKLPFTRKSGREHAGVLFNKGSSFLKKEKKARDEKKALDKIYKDMEETVKDTDFSFSNILKELGGQK